MLCYAFGYILGNMTTTMIFSLTTHPEAIFIKFFFHWRESSLGIYEGRIKRFSASVLIFQPPKPASFRKCFLISHFHYFSVFFFLFMFIPINGLKIIFLFHRCVSKQFWNSPTLQSSVRPEKENMDQSAY